MTGTTLDLFAGAGGTSLGFTWAGRSVTGIELDNDAALTHIEAGHGVTVRADVRHLDPIDYAGVDHLHASPPCQTFTMSGGKRGGRRYIEDLVVEVKRVLAGDNAELAVEDERTLLTLEPARWLHHLRPRVITFEQVPAVAPVWDAYASALGELGYSTWAGLLDAEQYGAPQARRRAWLVARLDGIEARPPRPTHSRYYMRSPQKLDDGVRRWARMVDALPLLDRSYLCTGGIAGEGRPRPVTHPAPTITGRGAAQWLDHHGQYVRPWPHRPDTGPLDREPAFSPSNVSTAETAALQGFPIGYKLAGGITSRYRQAGNAVPPQVAAAVAGDLDKRRHLRGMA